MNSRLQPGQTVVRTEPMKPNRNIEAYVTGCKAMENRDYVSAARAFDRAIQDDPESPVYYSAAAVTACLLGALNDNTTNALRSRVMLRMADIHSKRRQLIDAEMAYLKAIEIRKQAFGEEHERVIEILPELAALYHEMGRTAEAEILLHRVRTKSLEAA